MTKKRNIQKSALSFILLFSLGVSSFPLTTAIHADTQGAENAEKKPVSLTERTSLFFDYLQQGNYAEALQLTSAAFQSKFTANILQSWWTQSGGSWITWQLAKVCIPMSEIIEVTEDNTYAGVEKAEVFRIGTAYGTTDRSLIKTIKYTYLCSVAQCLKLS